MKGEKKNKHKSALYGNSILACCGFVCMLVVFLARYNQGKSNEHKQKQNKLDSISLIQDSIKLEKQTDTLSSQLSILDKDLKTLKEVLDSTINKEK